MRPAYFDDINYKKKQSEITHLNWQKGVYDFLPKRQRRYCLNTACKNYFIVPPSDRQKYCSHECHYFTRRQSSGRKLISCLTCSRLITQKGAFKYCSLKCQAKSNYNGYIKRWKLGLETGVIGVQTKGISGYLRKYIFEKYGDKCCLCGWNKKHPTTLVTPLEVNHIDGNSENNKEENLQLICPNCHALTLNFRNLNKGNGRAWRLRYIKTLN